MVTHPQVVAALAAEDLSESYGRAICQWTDKLPEDCRPAADAILLSAAKAGMDLPDLAGLAAEMYERSRPDLPDEDPARTFEDRAVHLETTFQGAGILNGDLTTGMRRRRGGGPGCAGRPGGRGGQPHPCAAISRRAAGSDAPIRKMHRDLHHPVRYPNSRHSLATRRRPYGGSFTSAAWDLTTRNLRLSCGCLHYGSVSTLTADGSSDNTGTSVIVHRPTAHATEATWRACLVSPLAASASATVASVYACRSALVIERATVAACWCWSARRCARTAPFHAPGHHL